MQKVIKVKIPSETKDIDLGLFVKKRLDQKALTSNGREKFTQIGDRIDVLEDKIIIEVTREYKEPIITMVKCNVCNCEYQSNLFKKYFHNYGGKIKMVKVCSDECVNTVLDYFGERVSKSKSKLSKIRLYR
jgi:hypothetical protein